MKPSPEQLAHCLAKLTRFIPSPAKPRAKEQKSKWGFKVGDQLSKGGATYEVEATDSLGLTLSSLDGKSRARLDNREDLEGYVKVPRPKRPRRPKQQPPLL